MFSDLIVELVDGIGNFLAQIFLRCRALFALRVAMRLAQNVGWFRAHGGLQFLLRIEPYAIRQCNLFTVAYGTAVAIGDFEGYVHFFSNLTGVPVARVKVGGAAISNAPVVVANRLYVQTDAGTLAVYEAVDTRPERSAPDASSDQS